MAESRLNVLVGAKIQGLEKGLKSASRKLRKFERSTGKMGRSLTQGLTVPMMGFAAVSIKAFDQQAKAEASLRTALGQNEAAFKSLTDQAKELQSVTLFGDETIIQQQSYLASLGMTEDQIKKVIEASIDLAAGTGQTLEFGVRNLAKTFAGLTGELGESIPALKELTTEQLKAGDAVDVVAEQFRGQARAAAEAGAGAWVQLKNSVMDFTEQVGEALIPLLDPLREKITTVTDKLSKLSQEQITAKVKTAIFVAAIGPLLIVLSKLASGLQTVIGVTTSLIKGLRRLFAIIIANPLGALATVLALVAGWFLTFGRNTRNASSELDDFNKSSLTAAERLREINKEIEESGKSRIELLKEEVTQLKNVAQANLDAARSKLASGRDEFGDDMSLEDIGYLQTQIRNLESDVSNYDNTLQELNIQQQQWNSQIASGSTLLEENADKTNALSIAEEQLRIKLQALREEHNLQSQELVQWNNRWMALGETIAHNVAGAFATAVTAGGNMAENLGKAFVQIMRQLAMMIVRAAIFAAIMTAITGGAMGGAAVAGGTNFASRFMGGLTGMATGGNMLAGQPYLVGEHGPELFTPRGSSGGQLSSAHQTAQMGTPDVKISGEDLIIVFDRATRHRNSLG